MSRPTKEMADVIKLFHISNKDRSFWFKVLETDEGEKWHIEGDLDPQRFKKFIEEGHQAVRKETVEKILSVTPSSQRAAVSRYIARAYPDQKFTL